MSKKGQQTGTLADDDDDWRPMEGVLVKYSGSFVSGFQSTMDNNEARCAEQNAINPERQTVSADPSDRASVCQTPWSFDG